MTQISLTDVRDALNLNSTDIPDQKLQKMIHRAATTLSLELNKPIDPDDCTDAEKEFITLLAAVYAICYLTGGSSVGLNFNAGDQNITAVTNIPSLTILQQELQRILGSLKKPNLRSA